ncbi:MAG: beta-ketoacyl-ACP reductase [Planctomycetota bacterium]|nr:beta-ketoacyl-ACP reductase [Planctomycetota bacterium]
MTPNPDPEAPPPTDDRFLADRVVLVTGASRGIGRAIAVQLARRGAEVACVATSAANCGDVVAACRDAGGEAHAFGCDVSNHADVGQLVKAVQQELGGLYALVNNAGVTRDQILLRMSEEDFDRVMEVNVKGTWNFIRAAARSLMKSHGRIVNISSVVGITGNIGQANYAASKAAIFGLTRSAAKELAPRGVCVNAIAPGFIETDMTAGIDEVAAKELRGRIPLKRIGSPEEVALAVDYLLGPGGAYVTGQTLVVDGGLSM